MARPITCNLYYSRIGIELEISHSWEELYNTPVPYPITWIISSLNSKEPRALSMKVGQFEKKSIIYVVQYYDRHHALPRFENGLHHRRLIIVQRSSEYM